MIDVVVLTPQSTTTYRDANLVTVPGLEGHYGFSAGHAPAVIGCEQGNLRIYGHQNHTTPLHHIPIPRGHAMMVDEKTVVVMVAG